jgi:hypothetical protein
VPTILTDVIDDIKSMLLELSKDLKDLELTKDLDMPKGRKGSHPYVPSMPQATFVNIQGSSLIVGTSGEI